MRKTRLGDTGAPSDGAAILAGKAATSEYPAAVAAGEADNRCRPPLSAAVTDRLDRPGGR
jgi:hypothetical protein